MYLFSASKKVVSVIALTVLLHGCSSSSESGSNETSTLPTHEPTSLAPIETTTLPTHESTSLAPTETNDLPTHESTSRAPIETTSLPDVSHPPSTDAPPTERPPPGKPCTGRRLGTYSWSQDYWAKGDKTLVEFLDSDMGREWNCGDLYINIADFTNYDKIFHQEKLVAWAKEWRSRSGNQGVLWMTYGDVVEKNGEKMVKFVQTFKDFLKRSVSAADMAAIGPVGLSFDVEKVPHQFYKQALLDAQDMKKEVTASMGYLPNSVFVDCTIEGQKNVVETEYVMRHSDRALMMVYRNELEGESYEDDLLERIKWMLTEQCVVCTQPGWEELQAKITIMVEASCQMGANCKKISFCAKDSIAYPDPEGGIQYLWNTLENLPKRMIETGLVTQAQFDHLFDKDTLFAVHNWEWSRCYYGGDFSKKMGFANCADYQTFAQGCRGQ